MSWKWRSLAWLTMQKLATANACPPTAADEKDDYR
jgi:hypothetical protein